MQMMPEHVAPEDISARLDGELPSDVAASIDHHLAECAECQGERERLEKVRAALRVRSSDEIPDLVTTIIEGVRTEGLATRRSDRRWATARISAVGFAAGFLLLISTSAPWRSTTGDVAGAAEIARAVRSAAARPTEYRATAVVTERGWHPDVPRRDFEVELFYAAPESFRLEMTDLTDYPSGSWPRNDVELITDGRRWSLSEPETCPVAASPACPVAAGKVVTRIVDRPPFDGTTGVPTDLIVPLETVASSSGGFSVRDREEVAGRDAYRIEMSVRDGTPLIRSLQAGGSWRTLDPSFRMEVLLDEQTWFPLGFDVFDTNETVALSMRVVEFTREVDDLVFDVPQRGARSGGWRERDWGSVERIEPAYLARLGRHVAGTLGGTSRIATYARGATWLKVTYAQPSPVPPDPGEFIVLGRTEAFYRPAGQELRRVVNIYGRDEHVRLESNLSRRDLLRVAASLPSIGATYPVSPPSAAAISSADGARLPSVLPHGYSFSSGTKASVHGRTTTVAHYRAEEIDLSGDGITISSATATSMLPPTSMRSQVVRFSGIEARWLPERGELEWIDGRLYLSVRAPSFDLATVAAIAKGLR